MNLKIVLLIALGGSIGATLRSIINKIIPFQPLQFSYGTFTINLLGCLFIGILLYKFSLADKIARRFSYIHNIFQNKYFFDELYGIIFVRGTNLFARFSKIFDGRVIDDLGPGSGVGVVSVFARMLSVLQSGYIFTYALFMLLGVIGVMSFWIMKVI